MVRKYGSFKYRCYEHKTETQRLKHEQCWMLLCFLWSGNRTASLSFKKTKPTHKDRGKKDAKTNTLMDASVKCRPVFFGVERKMPLLALYCSAVIATVGVLFFLFFKASFSDLVVLMIIFNASVMVTIGFNVAVMTIIG